MHSEKIVVLKVKGYGEPEPGLTYPPTQDFPQGPYWKHPLV